MNKLRNGLVNSLKISCVARIFVEVRKRFHIFLPPPPLNNNVFMLYTLSLPLACVQTSPLPQKKIHRHTQASLPLSARFFPPFSLNYIVPPMNHASLLWKATTSVVLEKNISKKQPESNELRKIALFKFISYLR